MGTWTNRTGRAKRRPSSVLVAGRSVGVVGCEIGYSWLLNATAGKKGANCGHKMDELENNRVAAAVVSAPV